MLELSPRERQVADLAATGVRNKQISDSLCLAEGTVKVYLGRIFKKRGVTNRTEFAVHWLTNRDSASPAPGDAA